MNIEQAIKIYKKYAHKSLTHSEFKEYRKALDYIRDNLITLLDNFEIKEKR